MKTTVIIRHRVADFATWKAGFDAAAQFRASSGMSSHQVFSSQADPQQVVLFVEFESRQKAEAHLSDPQLAARMRELGVLEVPQVDYVNVH
jgi:quinol monooxygenase YgiN